MYWHLTRAEGSLAGAPLDEILDNGGVLTGAPVQIPAPEDRAGQQAWLEQQLRHYLDQGPGEPRASARPIWVILPDRERKERHLWQDLAAGRAEIGFGRSGITLALSQINRLQVPASLVAIDQVAGARPDTVTASQLRVDLEPGRSGIRLLLNLVDGRLDGNSDLTSLLEQGCHTVPDPEVVILPGTGSDTSLDRLMPSLSAMGNWVGRGVRWEFAEARIGPLGVVGSLFNWYWMHEGYRLGEWRGPAVILDMDSSPLAGLSVVDYNA